MPMDKRLFLDLRPKPKSISLNGGVIPPETKVIEHKYDGYRVSIVKDKDGLITAYGRNTYRDVYPKLHPCLSTKTQIALRNSLPNGTIIDGEVVVFHPDGTSSDVPTALKRQLPLIFRPFCFICYKGRFCLQMSFEESDRILSEANLLPPERIDLAELTSVDAYDLSLTARKLNIEGFVGKPSYLSGWWKVKAQNTIDAFVVDYEMGKGKLHDLFGSLQVAVTRPSDGEIIHLGSVGTGFKEHERVITSDLIGRVLEIAYDSFTVKNCLRFPRFIRWREDKTAKECTL